MRTVLLVCIAAVVGQLVVHRPLHADTQPVVRDDELGRRASWTIPKADDVQLQLADWLASGSVPPELVPLVKQAWDEHAADGELLDRLAAALRVTSPEIAQLVEFCSNAKRDYVVPSFEILVRTDETFPFVQNNLRLLFGRWLVSHGYYDECLEQLASLQLTDVVDPSAMLFYRGVSHYRRLNKDDGLPVITQLLEREQQIPQRYATVAKLMLDDIKPLKSDSLDEVSRLMDSIKIRLGHARAGKRVRKEEDDVIAKLDKLIEKLEQQQQAAAAMAAGSPGNAKQSSSPMQDSMPAGGTGPGNVSPKKLAQEGDWGNLPPKEREEALQQLGKDFPSHYRDVIEEYFRKLAREGGGESDE